MRGKLVHVFYRVFLLVPHVTLHLSVSRQDEKFIRLFSRSHANSFTSVSLNTFRLIGFYVSPRPFSTRRFHRFHRRAIDKRQRVVPIADAHRLPVWRPRDVDIFAVRRYRLDFFLLSHVPKFHRLIARHRDQLVFSYRAKSICSTESSMAE